MTQSFASPVVLKTAEGTRPIWFARPVIAGTVPVVLSMVQWINLVVTDLDTEERVIELALDPACAMTEQVVYGDPAWSGRGGYTFRHPVAFDHLELPMRSQYDYTLMLHPDLRNALGSLRVPMRMIHHQSPTWSR